MAGTDPHEIQSMITALSFVVVLGFGEFEQIDGVADGGERLVHAGKIGLERSTFLAQQLGLLRVLPDLRVLELAAYFLETFLLAVVFKETPLRRRYAPRGR